MYETSEDWHREISPAVDSKLVLEQLDRMLKSRHFRNSRRYPAFLDHIVRHTLAGDLDSLKERILGIEVFKRASDYDTAADPVVRISAGEVRKRIALYYHDEGTEQELRIELPAGSYIPVFSASPSAPLAQGVQPAIAEMHEDPYATTASRLDSTGGIGLRPFPSRWHLAVVLAAGVLLVVGGAWYWIWITSPLQSMWRSFFHSPDPVLIVVGSPLGTLAGPDEENGASPKLLMDSHSHVHLAFTDALALTDVAGVLETHGQAYRAETSAGTTLDDLRKRPVVLIAAFGNPWSGRILEPLRFSLLRQRVAPDGTTILGSIVDRRHPSTPWSFDFTKPVTVNSRDYAIVARLHSDLTEAPVMVIAGLGPSATESAGEFVSTPEYLQQIRALAPANWRNKNLELVLEVPVVDGKAGHAHIVASDFW